MDNNTGVKDDQAKSEACHKSSSSSKSSAKSYKTRSRCSASSKSSVAEAAIRARASAEAARTKTDYAKKQLEIKMKKARLDLEKATLEADLEVLEMEKEAAAACVEAEVLEAAAAAECEDAQSERSIISPQLIQQRTEDYVERQTEFSLPSNAPATQNKVSYCVKKSSPVMPNAIKEEKHSHFFTSQVNLNPHAASYAPTPNPTDKQQKQNNQQLPHYTSGPPMLDFAKFLVRRELVTTGLSKFDDSPENFRAWQSTFFNATHDLGLTPSEQLDLLVKWLGKELSEHVKRIRAVHVSNPEAALELSWDRLKECYDTPEIVEDALFKRLDSFPRLTAQDNTKLRKLSDLLMELLVAKNDGYLPGLAYLDTPRGVKPIVEKLPTNLQDKWLSVGSRYKEEHRVTFPPFCFFVDFVNSQAKARNDPSFILSHSGQSFNKSEKAPFKPSGYQTAISVHKTDVATNPDANTENDPARYCPVHKKPHPLAKCRTFRMKTLFERKNILKEHKRCFKCCSPNHLAKDCQIVLKCTECDSDRHCSAMHPDTNHLSASSLPTQPGAESQDNPAIEVTSRCTEVCGEGNTSRSCSKVCLVNVFPQGQSERAIKMYIILDDQSNRSLARSEFFHLFGVEGNHSQYLMKTCAGTTEMTGRKAVGFQIEAVNGGVCMDLPPLIECNEIMANRSEIPTPEVALAHTHLRHIAPQIPELDPDAQTMILLGRDMIRAHKVRQQVNGPHNAPFAQCLDLGWVIVGDVCIDNSHKPVVTAFKTHILQNGRPSFLPPCHNSSDVKEKPSYGGEKRSGPSRCMSTPSSAEEKLEPKVFECTENDERAMSFEDEMFLNIMKKEVRQDETVRQTTISEQCHDIPSEQNPADSATRSVPGSQLMETRWFKGPDFLYRPPVPEVHTVFKRVHTEKDVNVRPRARSHMSADSTQPSHQTCKGWHRRSKPRTMEELATAKRLILEIDQMPCSHCQKVPERDGTVHFGTDIAQSASRLHCRDSEKKWAEPVPPSSWSFISVQR